jgi:hypothetical protein
MYRRSILGKIGMSETTYALVKDKFNCLHRGKVQAKGYRSFGRRNGYVFCGIN